MPAKCRKGSDRTIMTAPRLFGTDGIRGQANAWPMTADMALKVAMASALALRDRPDSGTARPLRALIGKDTRLSGYMLEEAMAAGFVAMGVDVLLVGPMPTPAVSLLTRTLRCDLGVMISASHNLYQDNGIKLFDGEGFKVPDDFERRIEHYVTLDLTPRLPDPDGIGKATRIDDAPGRYIEYIKRSFPRGETLAGLNVVIDCAHGAAYKVAPQVLWEMGAQVTTMGAAPNGRNINDDCGATHPAELSKKVLEEGADIGIALDGDADRVILVDEKGKIVDGDQLLALLAVTKKEQGWLQGGGVVATVMSNLGLERFLGGQGLHLKRTPVGDRHVVEEMRRGGYNLGGEQSGHIILGDFVTSGDGLLAALQVMAILREKGQPASRCLHLFDPLPQLLRNVRIAPGQNPLADKTVQSALGAAEKKLGDAGRILVRPSGTEPLVRVMAEGSDSRLVEQVVGALCAAIETASNKNVDKKPSLS